MEIKLRCSKVLITGGGSGIGKAIAKRLVSEGAQVTICGRTESKLESAKNEIGSPLLHTVLFDVSELERIPELLDKASSLMGGLDGVVNNAAVGSEKITGRGYEPMDITPEEWRKIKEINLDAAFFVMRDSAEFMKKAAVKGNVLNIASNAAFMDISGAYSVSKLSLIRLTHTFGKRFGRDGIIINGIAPGATFTDMISDYAHSLSQPYDRHAIGRFIDPDEIAQLAVYLMSISGEIICGHTVTADGGDKCAVL